MTNIDVGVFALLLSVALTANLRTLGSDAGGGVHDLLTPLDAIQLLTNDG